MSAHRTLLFAAILLAFTLAHSAESFPNTTPQTIVLAGMSRTFFIHTPAHPKSTGKIPLVIMLHGGSGTAAQLYEKRTGWDATADREGFLVAYPNSAAGAAKTGWSAHMNAATDDIDFLRELIQHLIATRNVDPQRVYLTGFSSGALLVHRAGIALGDRLAALGVVSGSMCWNIREGPAQPPPAALAPLPVIVVHGTADKNVPYDGFDNGNAVCWPVAKAVDYWVRADGITSPPRTQTNGKLTTATYTDGKNNAEVVFHTIAEGGHGWPVAPILATNDVLWDFFKKHPRTVAR